LEAYATEPPGIKAQQGFKIPGDRRFENPLKGLERQEFVFQSLQVDFLRGLGG
jgi:hypothetical protein